MIRFVLALLLLLAPSAFSQTGRPDVTVATIADAVARGARTNEILQVQNYSANVAWPNPRIFVARPASAITNAHDGVHYLTNRTAGLIYTSQDRFAPEQDASWWGAAGDVVTDDTAALNAAAAYSARYIDESAYTTLKGPGRGFLRIRPTPTGYLITNTVNIRASVEASGAALVYRGPTNVAYNALLVAPANPTSTFINNHTFNLPDVWGWDRGFDHTNSVGIRVQGIGRSTINFPYVYRFAKAVEFLCDTEAVTLCTFNGGFFDTCKISVSAVLTNNGYFNGNTWFGMRVNNENPNFKPGTTDGHEIIRLESFGGSLNGNTWSGGSWEGFPGQRLVYIRNGSANIFRDMRLEHHVSDYTNVVAGSLYMEVYSDLASVGIDNRIQNPNQGVNGMAGVRVKETGLAVGNMGASSQFAELRTRDNGYNHGPLVFTPSVGSSAQAMLSVYPQFSWPSNHWVNYDQWLMKMTAGGWIYKAQTDAGFRLWLEPSGNVTWATGASNYVPQLTVMSGQITGYDDTPVQRIQFDRYGSLRFYAPTTGAAAGTINPYFGSTFGGLRTADIPQGQLNGFTHIQTISTNTAGNLHYGFPGMDLIAGTSGTADYVYVSQGIYGPVHPHGYIQNRAGVFVDGSSSNAYGGGGYTIAMPDTWTDFDVRLGPTTSPSFKVDQSSTAGDTRLLAWVASSNTAVRIRHDDTAKLFYTGASLNPAVNAIVNAAGGSAGRVLSYVNSTTYAWSNAPSSFSFSDLTNAILAGSNISISYTTTNMTISSSGGGGATNGTAVSVDGGAALTTANFADASKVGFSVSGSNITATIVADSLGLADLDSTTEAYFLNRTNHTGTQNWTTIHSTPTTLSGYGITDAQPLDADLTRIANATWVLGDIVYRDATGLTNFSTTAAGRTLMSAVDAAAQRGTLSITNYQGGTGVQLTGTNFSHNIAAGTNVTLTTNGSQLVINASGGGSGTAVLVNGTNVNNPNFRRFFGISDSTNVDLLLSAGANVTFSTNSGVLTIAATGVGDVRTVTSVIGDHTATDSDSVIRANAASANITVTLPASPTSGRFYTVMKTGGVWDVIVDTGSTTFSLTTTGQYIHLVYMSGYGYFSFGIQSGSASGSSVTVDSQTVTNIASSAIVTNVVSGQTATVQLRSTTPNAVLATDSSTNVAWAQNMATRTIAAFRAQQGEPPASSYATFSTRNAIGTLLFDPALKENIRFRWLVPDGFVSTAVTVVLKWTTSATSGDARWGARNWSLTGDIDSDSFGSAVEATTTTSATAGTVMTTTLSSVSMDSAVAGDWVYLEVYRDGTAGADTINSNDLELHGVEVRAE